MSQPVLIRPEEPRDIPAVESVIAAAFRAAFDSTAEVGLVRRLRADGLIDIALVAEQAGEIIGHVVFSRLGVTVAGRSLRALALAPVAVRPGLQSRGTGGRLIEAGHARARDLGFEAIFVLGHPAYYPRFGYSAAAAAPFASPYAGPHFMALALVPEALAVTGGAVSYPPAFG